jgi:LAO/AO transport system kinase
LGPPAAPALRLGITGVPGVGKSTFIEATGRIAIARGHRVAVLAVDPSSPLGGGSILGDKTRMAELARRDEAFIRPSPAGETLGGGARRTRESIAVCEAAGFDRVIVETVGVGQSESTVADMVDVFLLLLAPGAGDELQGIKRGIVERADIVVVNKADGDLAQEAERVRQAYASALRLSSPRAEAAPAGAEAPAVLTCSALTGAGVEAVWDAVERRGQALGPGGIAARRAAQSHAWLWADVADSLLERLRADPAVRAAAAELEAAVAAGSVAPGEAARRLVRLFLGR